MSHEIEVRDGVAAAMYVKTPAWHELGTLLAAPPTIAEAIVAAGLDWGVDLVPSTIDYRGVQLATGKYAVVRDDDMKVLGNVGEDYRTVQNIDAFRWFQPFLDAGLADIEAAGSLRGGSRIWVLAKVRNATAEIVPGDKVESYILLAHAHDGTLAIHCGVTPIRVVCANTLSCAVKGRSTLRIRHTKGAEDALAAAQEVVAKANGKFDEAAKVYKALAGIYLRDGKQLRAFVDKVFPAPKKTADLVNEAYKGVVGADLMSEVKAAKANEALVDELLTSAAEGAVADEKNRRIYADIEALFEHGTGNDMPGVKGTAWGLYNAATHYYSHVQGRTADARQNNAWFGNTADRALDAAVSTFLT